MTTSTERTYAIEGKVHWQAPSNIALVKYWGKKDIQIPCNPSISFTLSKCHTKTQLSWQKKKIAEKGLIFNFTFEGKKSSEFEKRICKFLVYLLENEMPFLEDYEINIESENTFPHSSGIASSASAMAALALCLCDMEKKLKITQNDFLKRASYIARLGSGSASRSVINKLALWGDLSRYPESSDLYAIELNHVHENFSNYRDSVLIVSSDKKSVSSSLGHSLMDNHPVANIRFENAKLNCERLIDVLKEGDYSKFGEIVESEALELHTLMMTSVPSFILMKPKTLSIIEKVKAFRAKTNVPLFFTLDAGPNVHLLYPEFVKDKVSDFIEKELLPLTENNVVIHDFLGLGGVNLYE